MKKRHILTTQVLRRLGRGRIVEGPAADVHGNWECLVECMSEGKGLSVPVVIMPSNDVIVKTAY